MGVGVFSTILIILVIFNIGCSMVNPTVYPMINIYTIVMFITTVVAIACIVGVSALTFSLSENAQRLIFVTLGLIALLFQVTLSVPSTPGYSLPSIPVGLGLITIPFNIFIVNDFLNIGLITTLILGVLAIISGLEMAMGVGG